MVSREMIEIILKAEDQASRVVKENEQNVKRFGDAAQQANNKARQASQSYSQKLEETKAKLPDLVDKVNEIGNKGSDSFNKLSKSQQDAITKFNMLDNETQDTLQAIRELGVESSDLIPGADKALRELQTIDNLTNSWSGSLQYSKTKMDLIGASTNTVKGKIQTTGMAIQTYILSKWDQVNTKVSSVGQTIKSKIGNSLDYIKTKLGVAGEGFNKFENDARSSGQGLGFLHSMASMTVGMVGYDLFNAVVQSGRAAVNARAQFDYFASRMQKMTGQSKLSTQQLNKFKIEVGELQKEFRKVDMTAVAATAEELAVKMELPANKLSDLTRMTAVMSSQFVKEGRTQEDAVLAVADALDGQFMKLKEIGITQDMLKNNGWDGNLENQQSLIDALNKSMEKLGYDQTAKDITSLDDAFQVLTVSGGNLISKVLIPLTPLIVDIVEGLTSTIDFITSNGWAQGIVLIGGLTVGFALLSGAIYSAMTAEGGMMALMPGFITSLYGAAGGFMAISVAGAPLWAIVAAVAAIAVAVYGLGIYFGWWKDVGSMIDAIRTNIMRLWDAFINNPDVQGFIKGIGDAWNWLVTVTKPVVDWLSGIWTMIFPESATGQWDVTRAIIDGIGMAFQLLTLPIRAVISVLQILWPYLQQFYTNVLVPLGQYLMTALTPVFQLISGIIQAIIPYIMNMVNAFQLFFNGQITFTDLIGMLWVNLENVLGIIFTSIGRAIITWTKNMVSSGVNAASKFVIGVINRLLALPRRIFSILLNAVGFILSAGSQWVTAGVNKARAVVTGVMSNITQLPGKVYTEFMNIGNRILSAGSDLVNKAKQVGKNIVDGILGAMGIHSPGDIQEGIVAEFTNMISRVGGKVKSAYDTAKTIGDAIVDGFGNPKLETELSMPNEDAVKTQMGVTGGIDASTVGTSNEEVINSFDNLAVQTGSAFKTMVDKDKQAYDTIRNNDVTQLSAISSNLQSKMSNMTNTVRTNMDAMVNKNKTGMNKVKNSTNTQLTNMLNKTKSANSKMIDSWKHMTDGIVSAASKIKTDSSNHFHNLEKTIGGFYRKLQNPSGFGAGPKGASIRRNGSTNGLKRISQVMKQYAMPQYVSSSEIKRNPFISTNNIGSYITPIHNKYSLKDLIYSGNVRIPLGLEDPTNKGAGWMDGVGKHINKIKNTSKKWGMKGPKILGKYATSIGFKVKDFMNGIPQIDFGTFKQMAEDVFGQTNYEFYYDDQHHGNWLNALKAGSMNCYHGAMALINFAKACGLSGSLVHGHWGKTGHFWANIAGHKMDVTGWQTQRNWTPSASHAGPAPKSHSFEDFFNILKEVIKTDNLEDKNIVNDIKELIINGEIKIVHDFLNLPENISAEEIARLINETTADDNWIKSLVKNSIFQKYDLNEKTRLENKFKRAKGV